MTRATFSFLVSSFRYRCCFLHPQFRRLVAATLLIINRFVGQRSLLFAESASALAASFHLQSPSRPCKLFGYFPLLTGAFATLIAWEIQRTLIDP